LITSSGHSGVVTTIKKWRPDDINTLLASRCQTNPPTFTNIAHELNRLNKRLGLTIDRQFTSRDCVNKWYSLFPSSQDAHMTLNFLKELKKLWPQLRMVTTLDEGNDLDRPPMLTALHIVVFFLRYSVTILHYITQYTSLHD